MAFALSDVSLIQAVLVAGTAFGAAIIGGMAGYGTGLLLPLVLVPVIGAENVVPVIAVSALFTNVSRFAAMRASVDWQKVALMLPAAVPLVMISAYGFTRLDTRGASILIGAMLIVLVPLRRWLQSVGFRLQGWQLIPAGGTYGFVTGASTGAGVILVSFLMSAGLTGAAVIATDAAISIVIGIAKALTFGYNDALPTPVLMFALLVGCATVPGAFVAKWILDRLPVRLHTLMLETVIVIGGIAVMARGLMM
ncbi:sulfite exporter TauE/SafE family protein [Phreatobacter aquaticus]|uniref:Probable membrane transporter protein n=1 Tax=Phreatobacter aquaticus TaxID=2570229 RepID=A0A4D7QE79_9HYPH|nr:sulfite exporter TauE/SafE family protein [Phreatobacter aquaticus]QCK84811.1 sulfite exporter TauE/SafE family protein [Phreatobacter aquaticus]